MLVDLPVDLAHAPEAVAALLRSADGSFIGTCFCVSPTGLFLGAEHYLHSNQIDRPDALSVRLADGSTVPVRAWQRDIAGDVVEFRTEPVAVPVIETAVSSELPADGTQLWVAGYGLDRPAELRTLGGPVSGRERITVEPALSFEGFYVECDAVDGMSGSPAIDPLSGRAIALLSGLNPDWGIAAFCPIAPSPEREG